MTQKSMSALFDVQVPTVNEHLKNVFSEGELEENSVIRNFRITAADGKSFNTDVVDEAGLNTVIAPIQSKKSGDQIVIERNKPISVDIFDRSTGNASSRLI